VSPSPRLLWNCARLNLRVAGLALTDRWLDRDRFADGYDRLAASYDAAWQRHLRAVTDELLVRVPETGGGGILDLGCGTGYSTAKLAGRFAHCPIRAVDISQQMLAVARRRVERDQVEFVKDDMLDYLVGQPSASAGLIFSAWAIGYSHPRRLFSQAARVLKPGAPLAFVVNYADTLQPVFRAFRRCLLEFPDQVRLAAWLRFPRKWTTLARDLKRAGFRIAWHLDGLHPIPPPSSTDHSSRLAWLLQTGVLAGFDAMLPLAEAGPVAARFEELLASDQEPLQHHYAAVVAYRP